MKPIGILKDVEDLDVYYLNLIRKAEKDMTCERCHERIIKGEMVGDFRERQKKYFICFYCCKEFLRFMISNHLNSKIPHKILLKELKGWFESKQGSKILMLKELAK